MKARRHSGVWAGLVRQAAICCTSKFIVKRSADFYSNRFLLRASRGLSRRHVFVDRKRYRRTQHGRLPSQQGVPGPRHRADREVAARTTGPSSAEGGTGATGRSDRAPAPPSRSTGESAHAGVGARCAGGDAVGPVELVRAMAGLVVQLHGEVAGDVRRLPRTCGVKGVVAAALGVTAGADRGAARRRTRGHRAPPARAEHGCAVIGAGAREAAVRRGASGGCGTRRRWSRPGRIAARCLRCDQAASASSSRISRRVPADPGRSRRRSVPRIPDFGIDTSEGRTLLARA